MWYPPHFISACVVGASPVTAGPAVEPAYHSLLTADASALAWEWLRRDQAYREFYIGCERPEVRYEGNVRIIRLTGKDDPTPWGLVFRRKP